MPVLLSLIKQNAVSKMQKRSIVGPELVAHDTFVDNNLFFEFAGVLVTVELESLHEFVFVISIPLECLDDGHAALVRLDDLHRQVLHIILVVLGDQVTLHGYDFMVIPFVLPGVVVAREIEEIRLRILLLVISFVNVLLQSLNLSAPSGIRW